MLQPIGLHKQGLLLQLSADGVLGGSAPVTFTKDVTPRLPLRRPGLRVAPGSDWALLLAS